MNQLEALNDIRKQIVRDNIVNYKAIYLGDLYVYYNKMYVTIRSYDKYDSMGMSCILERGEIADKDYILNTLKGESKIHFEIDTVGFGNIYIDGLSDLDPEILRLYEAQKTEFQIMKDEYDEFVDYVNYHLDEIIISGGIV